MRMLSIPRRTRTWVRLAVALLAAAFLLPESTGWAQVSPNDVYCGPDNPHCCFMKCTPGTFNRYTYTCGQPANGSCEFCTYSCSGGGGDDSGPLYPQYQQP
jgi:hypothetical protein